MGEIKEAVKIPEFYRVILFLILSGLAVPSFGTFGYYFMLDVVKLSKFTIAMLSVLGYVCLLIGSALFTTFFSTLEIRRLYCFSCLISLAFAPLYMMFVTRINVDYRIPDMALIVFTDVVNDIISQCLVMLPMMIVFAKITPKRIEATAFAFLTGTYNLSSSLHGVVGSIVNSTFVGVS